MIDIHSHVLPMVDDGANSVDTALQMLVEAYEDGTDAIILTPHLAYAYEFINPKDKIKELFSDLKYIVKKEQIPIKLYLGCEFHFSSVAIFQKHFNEITTINDTRYLLMEFFFDVTAEEILTAIDEVLKHNLIPIIAHPERYDCIQNSLNVVRQGLEKGALFQMNKGSILGRYGRQARETVLEMLDYHYISFIGSDGHHPKRRSTLMYDAYVMVRDIYGKTYAKEIFNDNPSKMLKDVDIRGINNKIIY